MMQFFITLTILLLLLVASTYIFTRDMKLTWQQLAFEILTVILAVGGYYGAMKWSGFTFNYWSSIGLMTGLILMAWNFTNIVEKQKFRIVEIMTLIILPLVFYAVFGMDMAINILLGIYPVIIAYAVF